MSKASKSGAVSNVERRTWDATAAAEAARLKEEEEFEKKNDKRTTALTVRAPLKRREFDVDLYSRVGKHSVITGNTPLGNRGGYHCEVCDCLLKDSASYLDHINGKKHQRALGMNMRPDRSTRADVKGRLEYLKQKEDETEQQTTDIEKRLAESARELREAEAAARQAKRDKKKRKKNGSAGGADGDTAAETPSDPNPYAAGAGGGNDADVPPTGYRGDELNGDRDVPPDGWEDAERARATRKLKHAHIIDKYTSTSVAAAATAAAPGSEDSASTATTTPNDTPTATPTASGDKPQVASTPPPPPPPPPPSGATSIPRAKAAAAPAAPEKSAEELAMEAMGMSFSFGGSKKNK